MTKQNMWRVRDKVDGRRAYQYGEGRQTDILRDNAGGVGGHRCIPMRKTMTGRMERQKRSRTDWHGDVRWKSDSRKGQ